MNKREISHWSGQFFAAAELTRRGYRVSFTLGNAPSTDIVAVSARGYQFKIEVKTVRKYGRSWPVKDVPKESDLYYVLVVSRPRDGFPQPMYWVLTAREVQIILRKRERDGTNPCILKGDISQKEGGWEKLPDYDDTIKLGK
jgi:hypothetical protein